MNADESAKSERRQAPAKDVMPAEAGIHFDPVAQGKSKMDSRLRGNDAKLAHTEVSLLPFHS